MSRRLLALVALAALAAAPRAHVRLVAPFSGTPLVWPNPAAIAVVISSAPPGDIADGSHEVAIRNAIETWNAVPSSALRIVEDASPAQRDRTDFESFDLHQVLFDEDGSSGFFPESSGIVAITPVTFTLGGTILDADILFNGAEFPFTTSGSFGIDVQNVAVHELGHLLGLDHSGWGGATLYPFVGTDMRLHRSLSADDVNGAAEIAPSGAPAGAVEGVVLRQDASPVSGAHVSAVTSAGGRSVAGTLTRTDGTFRLTGLPDGAVTLVVDPLDGPIGAQNLSVPQPVETDFESRFGPAVGVVGGQTSSAGGITVAPDLGLVLGAPGDRLPVRAIAGQVSAPITLGGSGLGLGTTLETGSPEVGVTLLAATAGTVRFTVSVVSGAEPGHVDLIARRAGSVDVLPAAIEITPPDPIVSDVSPRTADHGGGTLLVLGGGGFRPGATVVVGEHAYREGAGLTFVDDTMLTVLTEPSGTGLRDVVVIDETGVEGRLASALRFIAVPVVDSVFPTAGSANGGTQLVVKGRDFDADVVVRLGGVVQPVTRVDERTLHVTTTAGATGQAQLTVENPGVPASTAATFSRVPQADPRVQAVAPDSGPVGASVVVTGSDFGVTTTVVFGADPETGLGGSEAASVILVSPTTLEVRVPPVAAGTVAVLVRDTVTGQAGVAPAAFTVESAPSGGGGGCRTVPVPGPPDPRHVLTGSWWVLLLALYAWAAGARPRAPERAGTPR